MFPRFKQSLETLDPDWQVEGAGQLWAASARSLPVLKHIGISATRFRLEVRPRHGPLLAARCPPAVLADASGAGTLRWLHHVTSLAGRSLSVPPQVYPDSGCAALVSSRTLLPPSLPPSRPCVSLCCCCCGQVGAMLAPHWHPTGIVIMYILRGCGRMEAVYPGGKPALRKDDLKQGDYVALPADYPSTVVCVPAKGHMFQHCSVRVGH